MSRGHSSGVAPASEIRAGIAARPGEAPEGSSSWQAWLPTISALVFLAAAATFINLNKSIWLDESLTLDRTRTSVAETIRFAREVSNKPPLYFLLTYWWRSVASSIEWARALSTVFILLTVVVFHHLSHALRIGRGFLQLGVLCALLPHFLWAAAEARVYAMVVFLLSCCLLFFARVWITGTPHRWRDTVLFVVTSYAAIMTFYYAGFVLAAVFIAGLLYEDRKRLVAAGAALALLFVPQALAARGHVGSQHGSYLPAITIDGPLSLARWVSSQLTELLLRGAPVFTGSLREAVFAGLVFGIIGLRIGMTRGRVSREEWWAIGVASLSFAFLGALRLVNRTTVDTRHWIVVAPPLLLAVALTAARLQPRWVSTTALGGFAATLLIATTSFVRHERGPSDWRGAVQWIMVAQKPRQPIVCFKTHALPIAYYYRGPNTVQRVPADSSIGITQTGERFHLDFPPGEVNRLRALLAQTGDPNPIFWIVAGETRVHAPEVIAENLGQEVRVLESRRYHRVQAYRVQLGAPRAPLRPPVS